jgi:hypothetical protein
MRTAESIQFGVSSRACCQLSLVRCNVMGADESAGTRDTQSISTHPDRGAARFSVGVQQLNFVTFDVKR